MRSGSCIASAKLYSPHKDLHHEWLGVDKLVLAGFKGRDRVFQTVDISDLSNAISTIDLGTGSGTPFVKYDHDTRMMFLYAKVRRTRFRYLVLQNEVESLVLRSNRVNIS